MAAHHVQIGDVPDQRGVGVPAEAGQFHRDAAGECHRFFRGGFGQADAGDGRDFRRTV
jgi:hypothetical protein